MQSLAGECEQSHSLTVCHGHPGDEMSGQPWVVELVLTREPGRNNTDFYYVVTSQAARRAALTLSAILDMSSRSSSFSNYLGLAWSGVVWSLDHLQQSSEQGHQEKEGIYNVLPSKVQAGLGYLPYHSLY